MAISSGSIHHLSSSEYDPNSDQIKSERIDKTRLQELYKRNAWREVLSSKKLFQAMLLSSVSRYGVTSVDENTIEIKLPSKTWKLAKQMIENLRNHLIQSVDTPQIDYYLYHLESPGDFKCRYYLFLELPPCKPVIEKDTPGFEFDFTYNWYAFYFSWVNKSTRVSKFGDGSRIGDSRWEFLDKNTIYWNQTSHHAFLTIPSAIAYEERHTINDLLFKQREETGDLELRGKEGNTKMHSCILDLHCDIDKIKDMFGFMTISKTAAELFSLYVYFEAQGLMKDLLARSVLPKEAIFELLEIAYSCQLPILFDCACNALNACVSTEDQTRLWHYYARSESPHLLKILHALTPSDQIAGDVTTHPASDIDCSHSSESEKMKTLSAIDPKIILRVKDLLARGAASEILLSGDFFLVAFLFCAYDICEVKGNDTLKVKCAPVVLKEVANLLESIRQHLLNSKSSPSTNLFVYETVWHESDRPVYDIDKVWIFFKQPSHQPVDGTELFESQIIATHLFDFLRTLKWNIECKSTEDYFEDQTTTNRNKEFNHILKKYTIHWRRFSHHTFLTKPITIPTSDSIIADKLCERCDETGDFSLITNSGPVKLSSCILNNYGGPIFKAFASLNKEFKDSNQYALKLLSENLATRDTAELLIESIYLGPVHVMRKLLFQRAIQKNAVFELLEIAYIHRMQNLFDSACNILSACATSDDLDKLKAYQEKFDSSYLEKMITALNPVQFNQ